MLHVMPRTREEQRTKVTKEVPGARTTHTSNKNAYVTCHAKLHNAVTNTIHKKMARRQLYVTNRAMVEAYRRCAHMHAKAPPQHAHSHRG